LSTTIFFNKKNIYQSALFGVLKKINTNKQTIYFYLLQ
ncbi:hypothetical protein Mgra_00000836, partial [Meloidogyne graminicola]